jgi:serine/threonine protein kinase
VKRIGKYEVHGLLGRGGMALVYKVREPDSGAMAALKLYAPREELAAVWGHSETRRRFEHEISLLAGLNHPNLIRVLDWGQHEGRPFFVMDYHCRSLALLIGESHRVEEDTRVLDLDQTLEIMTQVLQGLAALHGAGLVHRDITPANLLITKLGEVKICDFGLAQSSGLGPVPPSNLLVGSPYYAPPEQEQDPNAAGPASDLYSAGIVFLRMLTGHLWLDKGQRPSAMHGDLNRLWDRFFEKALAKQLDKRFESSAGMLGALQHLMDDWEKRRAASCLEPPLSRTPEHAACPHRSQPQKVPLAQAREAFELDRFWRPAHLHPGGFQAGDGGMVIDRACKLAWQRKGSSGYFSWQQAHEYVASLNENDYHGICAWRLPSVDELTTLLRPPPQGREHCLDPIFSRAQDWVWTCDRSTYTSAYLASLSGGFITRLDFSCSAQVKAVATIP